MSDKKDRLSKFIEPYEQMQKKAQESLDKAGFELDYMQMCLSEEIELLQELRGIAVEKIVRLRSVCDFNYIPYGQNTNAPDNKSEA